MKVLLINGSPHREGCTYTALCEVSRALNDNGVDTDIFWIGNKALSGCIACKKCQGTGKCVFNDSVNEFLEIAGDYDGFVFGTPVHWAGATGAMTSFMDRAFYADLNGGGRRFRLKPAAAVISARRAGTTTTWDQMNKYFGLMQMPIVTSQYWNMVGTRGLPGRRAPGSGGIADHADPGEQYGIFHQLQEPGTENGIEIARHGSSRAYEFYKILIMNSGKKES